MQTAAGLLAFPLYGGLIYAGVNGWNPTYSILIGAVIGTMLYVTLKGSGSFMAAERHGLLRMFATTAIAQAITSAIFFGIGYLFS